MTTRSPGPSRFDIETRAPAVRVRVEDRSVDRSGGVNRAWTVFSRGHVSSLDGGLASESMVTYKINTAFSKVFGLIRC